MFCNWAGRAVLVLITPERGFAGALLVLSLAGPSFAEPPTLSSPVDCKLGQTCIIQNYVAHAAKGGPSDYRCGTRTYPGHDGTDFRVSALGKVNVIAAAAGLVKRVRDGVPDGQYARGLKQDVKGRECGNGVIVALDDDWETQYCHLAQASVQVREGDRIEVGTVIGRVGLSGKTEFPHVHLTVRHRGRPVDPFSYGNTTGTCGGGTSLWADSLRSDLTYRQREMLAFGFAADLAHVRDPEAGFPPLPKDPKSLIAYVWALGLLQDDSQELRLLGPSGAQLGSYKVTPLSVPRAQQLLYTGVQRDRMGWTAGKYTAEYKIYSHGALVFFKSVSINLKD